MNQSTDGLRLPPDIRTMTGTPKGIERSVVGPEMAHYTGIQIIGTGLPRVTVMPIPLLDYLNMLLSFNGRNLGTRGSI